MTSAAAETARPHILVVGDAVIDRYIIGEASRMSPKAPVPVVMAGREEMRAGAEIVREHGGQVLIVPLLAGRSTTSVLAALGR